MKTDKGNHFIVALRFGKSLKRFFETQAYNLT